MANGARERRPLQRHRLAPPPHKHHLKGALYGRARHQRLPDAGDLNVERLLVFLAGGARGGRRGAPRRVRRGRVADESRPNVCKPV